MDKYQEALLKSIDIMIEERIKKLKFDYSIEGSIVSFNDNGTYNVDYNGNILKNIKVRQGLDISVGDIVLIKILNGNFSNKFIDLKRP